MALGAASFLGGVVIFFTALVTATIDPIIIKGTHFFSKTNGSEFFIRGVTYQPPSNSTPVDPLAVSLTCMRDIQFLSQLTTNVIRVSYIDPTQDHTACMTALASAGIYVLVDLPGAVTINSTNPEWNMDIYSSWIQKIDAMAGYTNVLGFFAGNNLITNSSTSPAAAFVKAAIRDLKSYMTTKNYRTIPIGYEMSASDNYDVMSFYMTCSNSSEAIDFLGISDFNWCSNSTVTTSGYGVILKEYASYPVPVFFADYGCKDAIDTPRDFDEVAYIYGAQMTNIVSGGIVFEYFEDNQDKGLVTVIGSQVSALADFTSYSSQIAKITPSSTDASNYVVSNTITPSCPTVAFSASPTLPPIVNQDVCTCMMNSLSCIARPGIDTSNAITAYEKICGTSAQDCPALHGDGSTGTYGAYSMCNITERLSWALDVRYKYSPQQCSNDVNAVIQDYFFTTPGCNNVLSQAGENGTGTITSFPSLATSTQTGIVTSGPISVYYPAESDGLSHGAIAGIAVGSIVGLSALSFGLVWFFCMRTRESAHQKEETMNHDDQDSRRSSDPDRTSGLRGGSVSIISDDSRDMSQLPRFDGSYMGHSWSRSEIQSSRSGFPEASTGRDIAAVSELRSPLFQHSDIEIASTAIPPSPMGSEKELPAFRTRMEDKSLASMKLLSPVVKVTPV